MKSILIISSVTFLLIFGGIALLSVYLGGVTKAEVAVQPADASAGARLLQDVAQERDRLQMERETLAGMNQSQAAREVMLGKIQTQLATIVGRIEEQQSVFVAEQDEAASRLAKMYEAMKPQSAARILSTLDMDVTLAIFQRMKERQAARILSYMDAGLAARLSTRLSLQGGA